MRARRPLVLLALCAPLVAATASCRGNGFADASMLVGLRVLAVKADPPEIAPGETSTLTPLALTPDGAPVTLDWAYCTRPPAPGTGSLNPDCILNDTADYLVPIGSGSGSTPAKLTMPSLMLSQLTGPDITEGFFLPVRVRARAGADTVTAVYSVRLALGFQPRNHNPTIASVALVDGTTVTPLLDGTPAAVPAGGKVVLRATLSDDSEESYPVVIGDPRTMPQTPPMTRVEELSLKWYLTAGSLDPTSTALKAPDTTLSLVGVDAGKTIDVWVVARDDRGGTDWQHRQLLTR